MTFNNASSLHDKNDLPLKIINLITIIYVTDNKFSKIYITTIIWLLNKKPRKIYPFKIFVTPYLTKQIFYEFMQIMTQQHQITPLKAGIKFHKSSSSATFQQKKT